MNENIKFSDSANKVFNFAGELTALLNTNQIDCEHLLYGILSCDSSFACKVLNESKIFKDSFQKLLRIYKTLGYPRTLM